jgi:hypothetical protein
MKSGPSLKGWTDDPLAKIARRSVSVTADAAATMKEVGLFFERASENLRVG